MVKNPCMTNILLKKLLTISISTSAGLVLFTVPAFAHVIVKPSQVGIASEQIFTVGVPSEKNIPTVGIRLLIPSGITTVIPKSKPGWTIEIKKDKKTSEITETDWTGGTIQPDQRDEFIFQAQSPATPTALKWKAYQAYQDSNTVA